MAGWVLTGSNNERSARLLRFASGGGRVSHWGEVGAARMSSRLRRRTTPARRSLRIRSRIGSSPSLQLTRKWRTRSGAHFRDVRCSRRKWPPEHWHLAFQGQLRTVSDADARLLSDRISAARVPAAAR